MIFKKFLSINPRINSRSLLIYRFISESNFFSRKPAQFATLDTLLDKLLFITISGDGMVGYTLKLTIYSQLNRSELYLVFLTHLPEILYSQECAPSNAEENASTERVFR